MSYEIAINYENQIKIVQVKPIQQMRGFLKGIDTTIEREQDRMWTQDGGVEYIGKG